MLLHILNSVTASFLFKKFDFLAVKWNRCVFHSMFGHVRLNFLNGLVTCPHIDLNQLIFYILLLDSLYSYYFFN